MSKFGYLVKKTTDVRDICKCGGKGHDEVGRQCPTCGGSGIITQFSHIVQYPWTADEIRQQQPEGHKSGPDGSCECGGEWHLYNRHLGDVNQYHAYHTYTNEHA